MESSQPIWRDRRLPPRPQLLSSTKVFGVNSDLRATCNELAERGYLGKAGVMGFCMGGLLTFMTAGRGDADAAVAYYPGGADKHLDKAAAVSIPMLIHLGEDDEFIQKDAQRQIKEGFAQNRAVKIYSYPGCSHAFARHMGAHYDPAAAEAANNRTWAFFAERLG